jgi:uncharacterized membrane protein (UPF0182 family)
VRAPSDRPPRPPRQPGSRRIPRGRAALVIAVVVIIVLLLSLRGIAGFWTDYLWFNQLGFGSVFTGILSAKIALALIFMAVVFVFYLVNLIIADRIAPKVSLGPQDEISVRYREAIGRHEAKVRVVVALLFALILGVGQSSQWSKWLLFTHSQSFHAKDPQFHRDISYYVFKLPFEQGLVSWAFGMVLVATFVTAVFHYLNGGIKLQTPGPTQRVSPQVKAHLSVLLGLLALIKGAGYYLQQYGLVSSTRGFVKGALYTDVHAQLPAFRLLMVISLIAFVLLMVNIYLRGWTLPALGVGLWFLLSIAAGAIYPALVQRYTVKPQENRKEAPYIQRNINSTRAAYGLTNVTSTPFAANNALTAQDLQNNATTVRNIRLWDPNPQITPATFSQLQSLRSYYQFLDTDVDRYQLGGNLTQTLLSVRELNQANLPGGKSWVNEHLQYTHGYGAVLSPGNAVTPSGTPVFDISNIPMSYAGGAPPPDISVPQVYFGEQTPNFSIVDSRQPELDYDTSGSPVTSHYAGKGGVGIGSFLRRAAFWLRFNDFNIMISGNVTSSSRIMYIRDVSARIHKVAPFLKLDSDPYAAVVNGRIVWVQDAYTTTDRYPYGQDYNNPGRLPGNSGLNTSFDYVRNSVKATVDAYDGTVTLYVQDPTDPIVNAWKSAFPKLFAPKSAMPADLVNHLRFPEDLFRVQTDMWGRYHLSDSQSFYQAGDAWNPAQDPGVGSAATTPTTQGPVLLPNGRVGFPTGIKEQDPFYLLLQLPGQSQLSFLMLQPMVALSQSTSSQQNMTAFMTVKSDPQDYGQISVYTMPSGQRIPAPAQIDSLIQQDTTVSKDISLLNTNGSEVLLGNVLTVPIDQSLLYIRPLYVSSKSSGQALPELKRVIVVYNNNVYYENTLQEALQDAFPGLTTITQEQNVGQAGPGGSPASGSGTTTTTPGSTTTTTPGATTSVPPVANASVAALLQQAQSEFTLANAALEKNPPDFATYQLHIQRAQQLIAQALAQSGGSGASGGSATTPASSTTTTAPASSPTSSP